MKTTTNYTIMMRGGSTVLFGKEELSELLATVTPISLRAFLSLGEGLPDEPPAELEKGIVVSGLETVLDAMPVEEAEAFLKERVRRVIQLVQNSWTGTGIVFGCSLSEKAFRENAGVTESVVFTTKDDSEIALSEMLWGRSQAGDVIRLEHSVAGSREARRVGYHVARIS